jgi:hypothetical protein
MPSFSIFGWQKPCYLLQDGYADSFKELLQTVEWSSYGTESGNPKCANCMVHSGYEASGVNYTFSSFKGLLQTAKAIFFHSYRDQGATQLLKEWKPSPGIEAVSIPVSTIARRGQKSAALQE